MYQIEKTRSFSATYDYSSFSVVRLHPKLIQKLGGRNTWIKISNGGKSIYRVALGLSQFKDFSIKSMEIDYDSICELDCISSKSKDELGFYLNDLHIEKANILGIIKAHWNHPNQAYKIPIQISLVSLALGISSVLISLLSI